MKKLYFLQIVALLFMVNNLAAQCGLTLSSTDSLVCATNNVTLTATATPPVNAQTLLTTFAGGNNHRGNMFDITATNTVTITSFDAHPMANTTIAIYYRTSAYAGFETSAAGWTLIGSAAVIAQPNGTATPVPVAVNVTIPAGQTYAFYVTSTNTSVSLNYTDGSSEGAAYTSDANITFRQGVGMEYPFSNGGGIFRPRVWNGNIHYTVPAVVTTTYLWSTGATTQTITPSVAATTTYSVTADVTGCPTMNASLEIVVSSPPVSAGNDIEVCAGTQATLSGSGAVSYTWTNGVVDGQAFTPASTLTYTVTGTDTIGCTSTDAVTVTVNALPTLNISATDSLVCAGDNVTLTANVVPAGVPSSLFTTTAAGNNHRGNMFDITATNTVTITSFDAFPMGNTTIEVYYRASPYAGFISNSAGWTLIGSGPVTYTGGLVAVPVAVNITIPAGQTYSFYVTSNTSAVSLNYSNGSSEGAVYASDANISFKEGVGLEYPFTSGTGSIYTPRVWNGRIHYSTPVALPAINYLWNTGATTQVINENPTTTTNYIVQADVVGCTLLVETLQVVVSIPPVNAGNDAVVCAGEQVSLSGSGAVSYTWDNSVVDGQAFTPASTLTYTVTGTDTIGCTATDDVEVVVNDLPTVDAGAAVAVCDGNGVTLSGSGATAYAWSDNVADGVSFVPVSTNTYTVTGTDANGCSATDNVVVTVNDLPVVDAGSAVVVCQGGAVTLSGSGATTYAWSDNVTDGVSFVPASTNTYTVTGTDANNCSATDNTVVTVNNLPVVDAGVAVAVCDGGSVTLSGSGAATYAWSDNVADGISFVPASTNTYTVTGTDGNNCSATDNVIVTVNNLPVVDAGAALTVCPGSSATLTGSGAVTYLWSDNVLDGVSFVPVSTNTYTVTGTDGNNCSATDNVLLTVASQLTVDAGNAIAVCEGGSVTLSATGAVNYTWSDNVADGVSFVPASTNTYSVTGTDGNNCSGTDNVIVTVNNLPVVDAGVAVAVCEGGSVTLSANGAATYAWSDNVADGVSFVPASTNTYSVTGTDANNCSATDAVDVTVNSLPVVDAGVAVAVCEGGSVTLSGSGAATYAWSDNLVDGVSFVPGATNTYSVTGTDANNCSATDAVDVTVNSLPAVDAGVAVAVCEGGSVTLSGSGAATYAWSDNVTDGVSFVPGATNTYSVTGTDANNCSATDAVDVTVNSLPVVNAGNDVPVCAGGSVTLSGSGAASYAWSGNVTDGVSFVPGATGTYTVTGTDANNCSATDAVDVTVNSVDVTTTVQNATVTATATGAAYQWINCNGNAEIANATAQSYTATVTGNYAVVLTQNGCVDTSACQQVIVSGITEASANVQLSVYPNPTSGQVVVSTSGLISQLSILDVTGKLVEQLKPATSKVTVELGKYAQGIYMLRINTAEGESTFKVVKE